MIGRVLNRTEFLRAVETTAVGQSPGSVFKGLGQLFSRGTVTGLDEAELLDRFSAERDEAAFAALVSRHGPMVLGVCRRILRDERDVEDAFQATFLILVRRAGEIRDGRFIGRWLHGVAHRVAVRSRARAATRSVRERPVVGDFVSSARTPSQAGVASELNTVLDEELLRLPATLRTPMVLCYLEGLTHDQAACRLGWPVGTVRSRMARARDILRRRLSRRGFTSGGFLLPGSLAGNVVPPSLLDCTIKLSMSIIKTGSSATAGSLAVAGLAQEVLHAMTITKLTVLGATGLTCVLALGGPTLARQFIATDNTVIQADASGRTSQVAKGITGSTNPINTRSGAGSSDAKTPSLTYESSEQSRVQESERSTLTDQTKPDLRLAGQKIPTQQPSVGDRELEELKEQVAKLQAQIKRLTDEQKQKTDNLAAKPPQVDPAPKVDRRNMTVSPDAKKGQESPRIWQVPGMGLIGATSLAGDRISIHNPKTGRTQILSLFDSPEPRHKITPVFPGGKENHTVPLVIAGPAIKKVAVYWAANSDFVTPKDDGWKVQDLREPLDGKLEPIVTNNIVVYAAGRHIYAFNPRKHSWEVLTLPPGPSTEGRIQVRDSFVSIEDNGHLYMFPDDRGKWSDLDTETLLESADGEPKEQRKQVR